MDQTSIGLDTVHIVIQLAVLTDDAVLHLGIGIRVRIGVGCRNRRIRHLAFCVKVVECSGEQIIGLGHPVALIGDDLAVAVHIVVITIDLNQAGVGLDTIDIVIQLAVLADDAVLHFGIRIGIRIGVRCRNGCIGHLAVCTKGVEPRGQQIIGLRHPVTLIGDDLAVAVHIVIIAVDLNQASVGLDTVDIVIQLAVLADDAVLHFGIRIGIRIGVRRRNGRIGHFAVYIEVVETSRQQVIGFGHPVALVGDYLAGAVYIVVIAIDLNQASVEANAVDIVIQFAVFIHNAILRGIGRINDHAAIFIKAVECRCKASIIGIGNPMTGVLHCRVVYASEIIVVSVFCQIQAVANHAVDGIIRISVKIE